MKQYHDLCKHVLAEGTVKGDRTGTGTISYFGYQMRYNLQEGFPMMTTKRVPFRLIASELLWFVKGDTNIHYLLQHNNHIWDDWAFEKYTQSDEYTGPDMTNFGRRAAKDPEFKKVVDEEMGKFSDRVRDDIDFAMKWGDLGPVYGKQWRSWAAPNGESIDQLGKVIEQIKNNPDSRRHLVVAYNPAEVDDMALPPCHSLFQFYVADGKLSCQLYQRSGDIFLGIPFNIASYALLTHMIAHITGLEVGDFVHTIGDAHIYSNHVDQINLQLSRTPKELPKLVIKREVKNIEDFTMEDFELVGYNPDKGIKGDVAV